MELQILQEIASKGEQVYIEASDGLITENFYKVYLLKNTQIQSIKINGVSIVPLETTINSRIAFYNVTEIKLTSGLCVGYKEL